MKRVVTLSAALLLMGFAAQANLFTNGSFETGQTGVTGVWGFDQAAIPAGSADVFGTLPGWSVASGGVEIQTQFLEGGAAYHGTQWVELDTDTALTGAGSTNSSISWSGVLDPGGIYEVSFYYRPRTATANSNGIGVYLDGSGTPLVSVNETTGTWTGWGRVAATFSLPWNDPGSPHMLSFAALGAADEYGGLIDNLALEKIGEIPEPATYTLVGFGLLGLYFVRRRRKA